MASMAVCFSKTVPLGSSVTPEIATRGFSRGSFSLPGDFTLLEEGEALLEGAHRSAVGPEDIQSLKEDPPRVHGPKDWVPRGVEERDLEGAPVAQELT